MFVSLPTWLIFGKPHPSPLYNGGRKLWAEQRRLKHRFFTTEFYLGRIRSNWLRSNLIQTDFNTAQLHKKSIKCKANIANVNRTSFSYMFVSLPFTCARSRYDLVWFWNLVTVQLPALSFIRLSKFISYSKNGDVVFDKLDLEGGSEWQPRNGNVFFNFPKYLFSEKRWSVSKFLTYVAFPSVSEGALMF